VIRSLYLLRALGEELRLADAFIWNSSSCRCFFSSLSRSLRLSRVDALRQPPSLRSNLCAPLWRAIPVCLVYLMRLPKLVLCNFSPDLGVESLSLAYCLVCRASSCLDFKDSISMFPPPRPQVSRPTPLPSCLA